MNYAKFAWLYLTQKMNFRETRVIRCSLGPLPGPEKVPLFGADCTKSASLADVVSKWRAKFAQFTSNSLYLSTKD